MSEKPVFNVNQKLFNQLTDWQNKMETKEQAEAEIEAKDKAKKISDTQKQKLK